MILKEEIAAAIKGQSKWVTKNNSIIRREATNKIKPSSTHIEVITGIRRCGKSTLMRQIISETHTNLSYLNFEDPRIYGFDISDFPKLDEVFEEENSIYFFDEIQNVPGWEVYVRQLHDRGEKVYITGSNASLLSRELGTRLTGRYLAHEIFPFSYQEFLEFSKKQDEQASFEDYLHLGGFPEFLRDNNPEVLQNLLKDLVFRDIAIRYNIKNTKTLMEITLFLISNVGKEVTFNSLKKTFGIGSATTVSDYLSWLEDAYLLFYLPRFSWSSKSISKNPKKVYCIDTGFAKANSLSFTKDQGRLLENLVYILLRKTRKKIYYFREVKECDFVVFEGESCKWLIQVTKKIHVDNQKRELDGLIEAMKFFGKQAGFILTLDQKDTLKIEGQTVWILPVKEFLAEYLS